jgi:hypothetical protein
MSETVDSKSADEARREEEQLRKVFKMCDAELRTGNVRSIDLINSMKASCMVKF